MYIIKFSCSTRGFFSIYLEAIRCIDFAVTNKLPFYVDLSQGNSLYSDPERFKDNTNVWEYYFKQQLTKKSQSVLYSTRKYEGCCDKIWTRAHFRRVHDKAVRYLQYSDDVQKVLQERGQSFPSSIIGVHIRRTDHSLEVPTVAHENYIYLIKKKIAKKNYKHIFLATDDANVIQVFKEIFSDFVIITNSVTRSVDGQPVHKNAAFKNKFELGLEAILDAYSLSLCNEVILTNSNLSYCALYFNPELKFTLLDGFQREKMIMFFQNLFYAVRYNIFHKQLFVRVHRRCRVFLKTINEFVSENAK